MIILCRTNLLVSQAKSTQFIKCHWYLIQKIKNITITKIKDKKNKKYHRSTSAVETSLQVISIIITVTLMTTKAKSHQEPSNKQTSKISPSITTIINHQNKSHNNPHNMNSPNYKKVSESGNAHILSPTQTIPLFIYKATHKIISNHNISNKQNKLNTMSKLRTNNCNWTCHKNSA